MHSIAIPIFSLATEWYFRPINTLQQKQICKVLIESENNFFILKNTIDNIILECLHKKNRKKYHLLTLLDKLIIILRLRCSSMGWEVQLETTQDSKKIKFKYNFLDALEKLIEVARLTKPIVVAEKNIKITCNIPSIQDEMFLALSANTITEQDLIVLFASTVEISSTEILLSSMSFQKRKQIINSIPASIAKVLLEHIYSLIDKLNSVILYKVLEEKISFNIFGMSYYEYIKFILREDLYNLYQETYILTKHINMSTEYVESLTALERDIYISLLKQEHKSQQESSTASQDSVYINNGPLTDLDIYKNEKGG